MGKLYCSALSLARWGMLLGPWPPSQKPEAWPGYMSTGHLHGAPQGRVPGLTNAAQRELCLLTLSTPISSTLSAWLFTGLWDQPSYPGPSQVLGVSTVGEGVVRVLQGRISGARWAAEQTTSSVQQGRAGQSLQRPVPGDSSVAWSSTLACGAQLCQQWSEACLPYPLTVVDATLLGLLISVLAPLLASDEFGQQPMCGCSHSPDGAVLITRSDISGAAPCHMCLL